MERLASRKKSSGLNAAGLQKWGMLFLIAGMISRAIMQNRMLGMADGGAAQLMELFNTNPNAMNIAAIALVLQILETCAVPIFAFLLVEGYLRAEDKKAHFLKILAVAAVSELPYNLASSGKILDVSSRNPVFGLVIGLVMMYFYGLYSGKGIKNTAIKALISAAAFLWCAMLRIEFGQAIVILAGVFWLCRQKPGFRILYGFAGTMACTAFSMFFMAAPMSLMAVHLYNGEPGEQSDMMRFWAYRALLAVIGSAACLLF